MFFLYCFASPCAAQLCWSFVHHFRFIDKENKQITDKSSRYKVFVARDTVGYHVPYSYSYDSVYDVPYHYSPINPCNQKKECFTEHVFDWVLFECGGVKKWMYFAIVDKQTNDMMNVYYEKKDVATVYLQQIDYRLLDSVPFMKGHFFIDGELEQQPTYASWFSPGASKRKVSYATWKTLIAEHRIRRGLYYRDRVE